MEKFSRQTTALAVGVLAVSLAIRLGAGVWWQSRISDDALFGLPDSESYWLLAESVYEGRPYEFGPGGPRVFRAPGYPLALAGVFHLIGKPVHESEKAESGRDVLAAQKSVQAVRVFNAVLGALAVGGVMWLAAALFDIRAALVAGLLAAFYPGAVAMSVFVLSEALFCPLMLAQLIAWTSAVRIDCPKRAAFVAWLGGVIAGAAILVRPSWLLFTPGAALLAVLVCRPRVRHAACGLLMMLGLVMAMAPWWVRNYGVTGAFVPTTLQVGASLYDGLNPQATGASDMRFVSVFQQAQKGDDLRTGAAPAGFEQRLDARLRDASLSWARANPGRVLELAGIKFRRMWSVWPHAAEFSSPMQAWVTALGFTPIFLAGLVGAALFARRGWPYVLCALPAVYFTCLHMIFVSSIRYRQPAMLPWIVLAAGAVVLLLPAAWKRKEPNH